jgi:type VI secretion system protein ImpG
MKPVPTIEKFFGDELQALRELGVQYAREHPDRARLLNPDAINELDPYVERLFEGFAFLTGRIREKIDGQLTEFVGGIMDLLWPFYNREIPSMAIVQFRPDEVDASTPTIVPRGTRIDSVAVGEERVRCGFMTTQDVVMAPIALTRIEKLGGFDRRAELRFHFQIRKPKAGDVAAWGPVRLYLHAERPTAVMLHEFLTRRIVKAVVMVGAGGATIPIDPAFAVTTVGFNARETILPGEEHFFTGYSLLREYCIFPEKFLFVDFSGLSAVGAALESAVDFTYCLTFDADFYPNVPFDLQNFRLFCSPVVNLFEHDIEPILHRGLRAEYPVVADAAFPVSTRIHRILAVDGIDSETGRTVQYESAKAFKSGGGSDNRSYAETFRTDENSDRHCFISPGGSQLAGRDLRETTFSIRALCCNGHVAREEIREGGLQTVRGASAKYVAVGNITRPTQTFVPPKSAALNRIYCTHLSTSFISLTEAGALQALLGLYDWSDDEGRKRRIEAIGTVTSRPARKTVNGAFVNGAEITIAIDEAAFGDINDLHLLGMVLQRFFSLRAPINAFVDLAIMARPSGTVRWFRAERQFVL